jgi:hypothetical protein
VKLANDQVKYIKLLADLSKHERQRHLLTVFFLKKQNAIGSGVVQEFMSKKCCVKVAEMKKFDVQRDQAITLTRQSLATRTQLLARQKYVHA